jgi:hypothetical protein
MAPLTVSPSKRKLALLTVGSFAFVVGGIFIIRDGSVPLILKVLGGYSGIVFFGMCLAYGLYRLMRPVPILVISQQGLFDNASAVGAGWLKWSEIKDVKIYRFMSQRFLGIIPMDLNAVLGRMSVWKRILYANQCAAGRGTVQCSGGCFATTA